MRLPDALVEQEHHPGDVLLEQGEPGTSFLVVLEGSVAITRTEDAGVLDLGTAGPGSILGELSLLTAKPRRATVMAATPVRVAVGDGDAFAELLDDPDVHERLTNLAAGRLAKIVRPMPVTLRDGTQVALRPLLPSDRDALAVGIADLSPESLRRRFFTAGQPSARVIDYLVNINYVDHFAWVATTDEGDRGVATARYIRLADDPASADVAFGVADALQGRGIATTLLGALGAAASGAGITRFVAEMLYENAPMRAVFAKAGATWMHVEAGVMSTAFPVTAAQSLLDEPLRSELALRVRDVVTAAGLALTR